MIKFHDDLGWNNAFDRIYRYIYFHVCACIFFSGFLVPGFVLFARINARIREMLRHTKYSTHNTRNTRDTYSHIRVQRLSSIKEVANAAPEIKAILEYSRIFFGHCLPRSTFIRNTSFIVADEVSLQHARLRNSNFVFKDESTRVIMYGEHVQRMQHRVPEAKLR